MRFRFSKAKSESLRRNPKRGAGFEEAQEVFTRPYYQYCHLVTLWRSTREERELYEANS